nr:hypothetical protein Cbor_298 [Cedratvirus borely]
MQSEPELFHNSPRSEPVSPRSEILIPIIREMEVRDILKVSLVYPELFDESMWRMLCKHSLCSDWNYYSFLSQVDRKRFAQIAIRKSFLPASTVMGQIQFAILNQRKDLVESLCNAYPQEVKKVCQDLSFEENIYFNRLMVNFAYSCLGLVALNRSKAIVDFKPGEKTILSQKDQIRMSSFLGDDSIYADWARRAGFETDKPKSLFINNALQEDDKGLLFYFYSNTQEVEILERMLEEVSAQEIAPVTKRNILCNLYRANHVDLALRFEQKYGVSLVMSMMLSCLADYYLNTGDERGLYLSLLALEEQNLLLAGFYHSKIFDLELDEIATLLERNAIYKVPTTKLFS